MRDAPGPSWVGIGAQRCGTTWFTDLLCTHPQVVLAANGRKEQHAFNRSLVSGWGAAEQMEYRRRFTSDQTLRSGEFTPFYLRGLWVPPVLVSTVPDAVVVVVLRDPVDRFESAMRHHLQLSSFPGHQASGAVLDRWIRLHGADQQWAGCMPANSLAWRRHLDPHRLIVLQYEQLLGNPSPGLATVWSKLGLPPVEVTAVRDHPPATTSTDPNGFDLPAGLAATLARLYRPQVRELAARWRIDPSLWRRCST